VSAVGTAGLIINCFAYLAVRFTGLLFPQYEQMVSNGVFPAMLERRKAAREYKAPSGPGTSKYVFHRNGKRISDPRRAWARACYDAGLPCEVIYKKNFKGKPVLHKRGPQKGEPVIEKILSTMFFHDLRRSGVRNMVRSGVRETVAMAISGHRTRSIFDRYNITSDDDLRQAVKQTLEYVKAQPAARKVVAFRK
jgi:hypothetical protein